MSQKGLKIICLFGATATGKTALSLELAKRFHCELISVDSTCVYRGLDIGSGKPTCEELSAIPHHLVDVCDPAIPFNASKFKALAQKAIAKIHQKGKTPLLVGGTMLYFKVLMHGLSPIPQASPWVRAKLLKQADDKGWAYLHEQLNSVDPLSAQRIHPNDQQRIQRALEVYQLTGKPLSSFFNQEHQKGEDEYQSLSFGLVAEGGTRNVLHQKIEQRFDDMLKKGLIEEVKVLYSRGDLSLNAPSMRAVGYRQVWQYLHQEVTFEQMREKAIAATRQLGKRQLTWLRSWPDAKMMNFCEDGLKIKLFREIEGFLNR